MTPGKNGDRSMPKMKTHRGAAKRIKREAELHIVRADGELDTAVAIELVPALPETDQE